MAIKFKDGEIRLWKTGENVDKIGMGIKFEEEFERDEMLEIFEAIKAVLTFKYGEGEGE